MPISINEWRDTESIIKEIIDYNPNRMDSVTVYNIPAERSEQFAAEDDAYFK